MHTRGIGPYANLKYEHYDDREPETADYTEEMRARMVKDFAGEKNFNFYHFTDRYFMNLFNLTSVVFDLVHFDGPHMTRDVMREALWFADRARKGTRLIFEVSGVLILKSATKVVRKLEVSEVRTCKSHWMTKSQRASAVARKRAS